MKEKGSTLIILLIIVTVGVVIGVGFYILSNSQSEVDNKVGSSEILQTLQEKIIQPKPAEETRNQTTQASPTQAPSTNSETPLVKADFSQEGAFFAREDGWTLLWDEPGRLALNVKVKFDDQSVCYLGGEKKDCALINMGPQSYDRVSLEGVRNGDEVTATRLEEIKMPQ